MGWGQIAHTLGVPPSRIGLGHQPSQAESDTFRASHGKGKEEGQGLRPLKSGARGRRIGRRRALAAPLGLTAGRVSA